MIEKMPCERAIALALEDVRWTAVDVGMVSSNPSSYAATIAHARMIEKYEPERLVDPVESAAKEWAFSEVGGQVFHLRPYVNAFKAGAEWQKDQN